MAQDKILEILLTNGRLFSIQIINIMKEKDEPKEYIKKRLKQMRKYHEIGFVCIGMDTDKRLYKYKETDKIEEKWKVASNKVMYKKFPELKERIEVNKKPITRPCYLYFLN